MSDLLKRHDQFAIYMRGVESGVMKSATPNAMKECLEEIFRLRAELADQRAAIARLDAENERLHEEVADEHMRCEDAREAARWFYTEANLDYADSVTALARWSWLDEDI